MTSQGSPRGRFQRAIQRGSLFQAELTARELGALTLADALALTVLIGKEPERYGRAAVRQHGRFELEARRLDLWESQLALAGARRSPEGSGCCGVGSRADWGTAWRPVGLK
jgi:hypothetical protein